MKEILITSSVLILSVIILRLLFRTTVSRRLIYGAWLLVALRLLVPVQFGQLNISILNQTEPVTDAITDIAQRPVSGPSREELYNDALREQISQGGPVFIPEVQEQAESQIQHSGRPAEDVYEEILGSNKPETIILPEVNRQIETVVEETVSPTLGQIALGIWIIGMVSMAAWFLGVNLSFRRSLRSATESPEPGCETPIMVSAAIASPCVFGLLRPVIYLTPNCVENMRIRRHVLTHEQTHLRHGDHIWAWVRCILLCIYWFHPLVWIAAILSKRDCELACDEAALKTLGEEEHLAYGKTLVDMVAFNPAPGHLLETATAMHETKKQLKERVNCIVKKPKVFLTAAIALLLVLTIVTGCAFSGPILKPAGIGNDETAPTETQPPTTTIPPTTVPATDPTTQPQTPEKATLTILVAEDVFDSVTSWSNRDKSSVWPALEAMLAEKGVSVEWIIADSEQYVETLADTLVNSERKPDLIWLGSTSAKDKLAYAEAGYFTAIDDVLPYSDGTVTAWLETHPFYEAKIRVNGKLWWFGSYNQWQYQGQNISSGSPSGICVREDWMKKLGMTEVPDTIEELEAYLLACRNADVNGNGLPDEMAAFRCSDISTCFLSTFYGVPFGEFSVDMTTGQVVTPWESTGVKDMLRTCVDWAKKGYMNARILNGYEAEPRLNNQLAIQGTYFCDNWTLNSLEENNSDSPPVLVGVLPNRSIYPNAYIRRDTPHAIDLHSMAISSECDNPEAVAAVLDVLTSKEYQTLLDWGVEGYSYELDSNGNPVPKDDGTTLTQTGREMLSNYVLPDVFNVYTIEEDESYCRSDLQLQQMHAGLTWEARFLAGVDHCFANPTAEESAVLSTHYEKYEELSLQIYQDILMGKINIDTQWESHVLQPLQAAGMDELKAVYQAQFDRFMEAANS